MARAVATHHNSGPAVNVKFYGPLPDGGNEAQREEAWTYAQEDWWREAKEFALECGFSDLWAEGRSGGYAQPVYNRRPADLDTPEERRAFTRFHAWCEREMKPKALADRFSAHLAEIIADTPEPIPAPPADECARFLAYCENKRDTAATVQAREFWQRLAGSVRKAGSMA